MFVALSVEDTVILNVDVISLCSIDIPSDTCSVLLLPFQEKIAAVFAIPTVQLNSATLLSEMLTDLGGMVMISGKIIQPTMLWPRVVLT